MDVCVCQNSWNCTLKMCQVCVCKLYIKKQKEISLRCENEGWIGREQGWRRWTCFSIAFSVITVYSAPAQSPSQSAAGPYRGVQDGAEGLDFQRAIVPPPFPGNEENHNRPSRRNLLLFGFHSNTWYLTPLESMWTSSIRAEQKTALSPRKCLHQNVTSAGTRETQGLREAG